MTVVNLFDEVGLMCELRDDTVALIHATSLMDAIKKLVEAHEIIDLNLTIHKRFYSEVKEPAWDLSAIYELKTIRREIIVYYRGDFDTPKAVDRYTAKMGRLFHHIETRIAQKFA